MQIYMNLIYNTHIHVQFINNKRLKDLNPREKVHKNGFYFCNLAKNSFMSNSHSNIKVDDYLRDGCGRCSLHGTPACKVHTWKSELHLLRKIMLETGLVEEIKWGVPCYTFQGKNIVLLGAFKDSCVISFPKGALLLDSEGVLVKPGENSHEGRVIRFHSVEQISNLESTIHAYVIEAVEAEKLGLKITPRTDKMPIPEELEVIFKQDSTFENAFYNLTPGRQKGYLFHFNQAKQSKTRIARIEKYKTQIFQGIGLNER
jgi:uncharacterized protein YdeI (YjbR/CyaY-like superfamily)